MLHTRKIRRVKSFSILLGIFILCTEADGQGSSSPYSIFASGQIMDNGFGVSKGMGNAAIALQVPGALNPLNPASYNSIDSLSFIVDFGMFGKYSNYTSTNSGNQQEFDGNLSYLAFGFRLSRWWATSMGAVPLSSVNYKVEATEIIEGALSEYYKTYTGSGGVNKFFLGNALNIGKNLSLGMNISYVFGSVVQSESVESIFGVTGSGYTLEYKNVVKNFLFDYGIQQTIPIKENKLRIGAVYTPGKNISASQAIRFGTSSDTVELSRKSGDYILPQKYGFGLAYEHASLFKIATDYERQNWSEVSYSKPRLDTRDSEKYSIGLEYTPVNQYRYSGLKSWSYRLGGYLHSSYLIIDNVPIDRKAITIGAGIPLNRKMTKINLSAEFGKYGQQKKGLVQENYVLFSLNFNLNEKWFQKPQYD